MARTPLDQVRTGSPSLRAPRRPPATRCPLAVALAATALFAAAKPADAAVPTVEDLKRLSIEELANIRVTSVSKRPQALSSAPAAVFVITAEDIRRSGATSLPEALRLAPNLHVARVDASAYTISARGFNTYQAANKLLVLIDGRSMYSALHGGVLWDQQQVMLEDIDRIEVISGPGGTLWGTNAVNGVINVITKPASATQGGLAAGRLGTEERSGAARFGGALGDKGAYRVYGLASERDNSTTSAGRDARDDFTGRQSGFRFDWAGDRDTLTAQGDVFENDVEGGGELSGGNFVGRWTRRLGEHSSVEVQGYYDQVRRIAPGVTDELETFDIAGQHGFRVGQDHAVVWGAGYRTTEDKFVNTLPPFVLIPEADRVSIANLFLQDSIALDDGLTLTLGTKLEYSSYTGLDYLPSGRVSWQVTESDMLWGAISRAVRTPSRIDRDFTAPGVLDPARDLTGETLIAYELGYRGQLSDTTSLSVSVYYNDYDDLRVLTFSPDSGRFSFGNAIHGYTYGLEAWSGVQVTERWRFDAGLNLLQKELDLDPGAIRVALSQHRGNDPEYQFSLRSRFDVTEDVEFDIGVRFVDDLPDPDVPGYAAVDARLGWHVTDRLELSVAGFNVFDDRHPETGAPATWREVQRSVYAGARWRF